MQRSRLKNIINKSKDFSTPKQELIREPFDEFKKTLPEGLVNDNYRLEAAWKAYGKPKDLIGAIWEGMILPIDENTYKLPSIGYNEETDEYEYLNKGEDNETVAKDIRVWDNDVIPLVQELKRGGYVRTFNEEKDCWTYTKNKSLENTEVKENDSSNLTNTGEDVEYLKKGGKPKFEDWYKTLPEKKSNTEDYDLEKAYNELINSDEGWKLLKKFRTIPDEHLDGRFKKPNHPTYGGDFGYGWHGSDQVGWTYYVSPRQIKEFPERTFDWYKEYWNNNEPHSILNYNGQTYKVTPYFKQGGQMSVIPEGALHARKNNMEGAGEDFTAKGIPVVDNNGEQQAEIEVNELILSKDVTDKVEELYKKYNEEESSSKKDEIAIKMGKIITCEITKNTLDNTGIIEEVKEKM